MATLDYIGIPPYATRLQPQTSTTSHSISPAPRIRTSLPHPPYNKGFHSRSSSIPSNSNFVTSPTKTVFNILPQLLLSTSLPSGFSATIPDHDGKLLSNRDPLSIPTTTANFRRFVTKVGVVFWLQDRIEEIVMWRRGWKVTGSWMAAYAFLCYYPRLILLLPIIACIGIMLATYPYPSTDEASGLHPPPINPSEGTVDWQANIQGIQNLMGAFSDFYDLLLPLIPYLTHKTPYTLPLLAFLTLATLITIPFLSWLPMTPALIIMGYIPCLLLHPLLRPLLPLFAEQLVGSQQGRRARIWVARKIDDARLSDAVWRAELREVELWENERWAKLADGTNTGEGKDEGANIGWSKGNLRAGERIAWTRGRDGWSGVKGDGSGNVSNLTFSLEVGWAFVETEDWRIDLEAKWASPVMADPNGWVYTDNAWLLPRPAPLEEWKTSGMTRRRRWIRRIYYNPSLIITS